MVMHSRVTNGNRCRGPFVTGLLEERSLLSLVRAGMGDHTLKPENVSLASHITEVG
jgi:hypothetical protein